MMKKTFCCGLVAVSLTLPVCQLSQAEVMSPSNIKISGFGSVVGNVTNNSDAEYLRTAKANNEPDFVRETFVGIQFNVPYSDEFEFITQFTGDYKDDTYSINAEWIVGKWRVNDKLTVRGGRFILPLLAQSDTVNVNYAHPWIRNPAEVYEMLPISNFNGVDLIATLPVGDAFVILQPFYGATELQSPYGFAGVVTTDIDSLKGLKIRYETDNHSFNIGAVKTAVSMRDPGVVTGLVGMNVLPSAVLISRALTNEALDFYSAGWIGHFGNFEVYSEVSRRDLDNPAVSAIDGAYVTGLYNIGKFAPSLTLAKIKTERGKNQTQDTATLSLRQSLLPGASLKYELQYGKLDDSPNNRGLFALSNPATAKFPDDVLMFSVGLDVSF